ncbi:hypothetical protein LSH36_50g03009 [Paralvinella palmiformis]|uniref:MAM domain-containing protein n=1 Tax=Paralvinella palmiformis TaxID=53620 RepID=A0AAD9K5P8_9ANNE|nr:hypothetical protein LSH36_50g03009 [Paralvinella palmiformis]
MEGGGPGYTLETCKLEALDVGVPAQRVGIACSFEDECLCGYTYTSDNINDIWLQQSVEEITAVIEENGTSNSTEAHVNGFMKVKRLIEQKPLPHHKTYLISPQQDVTRPSCLSWKYLTSYVDIDIYTYTDDEVRPLVAIMHDGQEGVWHKAYANVPIGRYGVIFQVRFGSESVEDNGIDDVILTEGVCWKKGSRFGLGLTMNIEQYEYMRGPQSDAGIKAALSILSVDNILSQGLDKLTEKYNDALEVRQRIEPEVFVRDLTLIRDIAKSYTRLRQFAKTYLGDFEKSSLAKLWIASSTLVNIFKRDIEILFDDLSSQMRAFRIHYETDIKLVERYIVEMNNALQEMEQLFEFTLETDGEGRFAHFVGVLSSNVVAKGTIACRIIRQFYDELSHSRPASSFLPRRYTLKYDDCVPRIKVLSDSLGGIIETLSTRPIAGSNLTNVTSEYRLGLAEFRRASVYVKQCIAEYKDRMYAVFGWKSKALREADDFIEQSSFFGETFNFTEECRIVEADEKEVDAILLKYSYAAISKLDYLRHFDPDEQTSAVVSHIKTFTNRIKHRLTDPLRERLYNIRRTLKTKYEMGMRLAGQFEPYFEPFYYYQKAQDMTIWRVPLMNLENPDRVSDTGREMWKIWNREQVDTATFVKQHAPKYIREGLNTYCQPLQKTLDEFEEQLFLDQDRLLNSLNRVHKEQERYLTKRKIDHKFVLDNFLNIDVYFAQLKHQNVKQMKAYDVTQFLGGSVITVFELLDLIVFHFLTNLVKKAEQDSKASTPDEKPALKENEACIDDLNLRYGGVYVTQNGDEYTEKDDYPYTTT